MRKTASFLLFFLLLLLSLSRSLCADKALVISTEEIVVLFEKPLEPAAREVVDLYKGLKLDLEASFGWSFTFRPKVLLIKDRERFTEMVRSDLFVALAVPERDLIVIDYSRMNARPFTLKTTLKHELCHLLLHHHIRGAELPTWLDEGVAQWASEGFAEIIMDTKGSLLRQATLSGRYIPMGDLAEGFPRDRRSLILAYEESKSFVEYINREFGEDGILRVLGHLKNGNQVDAAILKGLSIPLDELETRWHSHLRKKTTWVTYLSTHLYGILFFVAALITIGGFVRLLIKRKRRYADDDDNDDDPPLTE
jgi:hypothetical protein